ncbi:MAG: tRNA epoxyqueuosine(34) reductase QueG [bacterium]
MNKKVLIKNKAKELGFDLVGITTAEPFSETYKILNKRKDKGTLPDFMNKDIKLITHPRLVFNKANSIISVAISYATDLPREEAFISRYSRGIDYHKVISTKLKQLSKFIKNLESNIKTRYFCDTGPLLERKIAVRAGLGWIGKNTNLINEKYGSYLFLGEILTNLKLTPDSSQINNKCDNCKNCLKQCQGKALIKPYVLDQNKCVSYLTQKKGILTEKEREIINGSIWGCDICQEVCPYNKDIPVDIHPEFSTKIKVDIEQILKFENKNIPQIWKNAALSWRGIRILKRNALIVIKNKKYIKYLSLVKEYLNHPSPIIRSYALWTLCKIDSKFNKDDLLNFAVKEKNKIVLNEINKLKKIF